MARTARDVEAYLSNLGHPFERVDEETFVVHRTAEGPPVAVRVSGTVIVLRVLIGQAPVNKPETEARLFRRLLELNAAELLYSSYGLEEGQMVLTAALELENLDINEIEAAFADMDLAIVRHVPQLHELSRQ